MQLSITPAPKGTGHSVRDGDGLILRTLDTRAEAEAFVRELNPPAKERRR